MGTGMVKATGTVTSILNCNCVVHGACMANGIVNDGKWI